MVFSRRLVTQLLSILWLIGSSAIVKGQESTINPAIAITFDGGWKILNYKDNKPTEFSVIGTRLRLNSERAVAFYYHRLPRLSQISHCDWHLSFDWRVLEAKNLSQQNSLGEDDRPLAVHIWVNDPFQFGWLKGSLAKLFSLPAPGYMLTYSWGVEAEWRQTFENPHIPGRGYISVIRNEHHIGDSWYSESINISQGLREYFNDTLITRALYVVISADTEDSQGSSMAEVKGIVIAAEPCQENFTH